MTLNEKYCDLINSYNGFDNQLLADRCEFMAEKLAIEFSDWINLNAYKDNVWKMYYTKDKEYTTNELLEIYKKEKGL